MLNKYIILCRLVPAAKAFFIGYAGEAVPGLLRSLFKPSTSYIISILYIYIYLNFLHDIRPCNLWLMLHSLIIVH